MAGLTLRLALRRSVALWFATLVAMCVPQLVAISLAPDASYESGRLLAALAVLLAMIAAGSFGLWEGAGWGWWLLVVASLFHLVVPTALHLDFSSPVRGQGGTINLGMLAGLVLLGLLRPSLRPAHEESGEREFVRQALGWWHMLIALVSLAVWILGVVFEFDGAPLFSGLDTFLFGLSLALAVLGVPFAAGVFLRQENPAGVGLLVLWYPLIIAISGPFAPAMLGLAAWTMYLLWRSSPRRPQTGAAAIGV